MDISTEIAAIQAASQGSELRQPLVGALNKLNSGALPAVTSSDAGKILKVGANGWEVGEKSGYIPVPTATKQITENGTHDVTDYASAIVNVSGGGGGGNGNTILHDTQYQTSGSFSYSKEITIPRTGIYKITVQTYSNGFSLKINNVEQSYSLSVSSDYTYLYYAELSLNAGDVISMSCTSTDKSIATFVITDADGGGSILVPKTITQNGTYDPTDDNADGYSEVTVNVSNQNVKLKIGNTNPTINASGIFGIMSNYSSDYIVPVSENDSFAKIDLSQPFEICCRFKVANNPGSDGRNVWGSSNSYYHCPTIAIYSNKIGIYITSNGSSWNVSNGEAITPSGYSLPLNTWITAIMAWDGTDFSISVDDGSNTYIMTKSNATPYYNPSYSFEFGGQNKSGYSIATSNASIDLSHTYLKQNGLIVWGLESVA